MDRVITLPAPAKLNLFLAVTGRRADGFHELVSVVAPLAWGDELETRTLNPDVRSRGPQCGDEQVVLVGEDAEPEVPTDESNLVLKAAREFRAATGWSEAVKFGLKKRVPVGAGLGGGSSDAAAALRSLNELAGEPLGREALMEVAARVGSDCASFLTGGPVIMRGRGERVKALPAEAAARLSGRRVLVFKPAFGISTAWSYRRLAEMPPGPAGPRYAEASEAEARLAKWIAGGAAAEELLFNSLERPAFEKFPALPLVLERLRRECGVAAGMSGSGSACFAMLGGNSPVAAMAALIREAWGNTSFITETTLA